MPESTTTSHHPSSVEVAQILEVDQVLDPRTQHYEGGSRSSCKQVTCHHETSCVIYLLIWPDAHKHVRYTIQPSPERPLAVVKPAGQIAEHENKLRISQTGMQSVGAQIQLSNQGLVV